MNNTQILRQMQLIHKEVSVNLEELEHLKVICNTEISTEQNKKQYEKLYTKTKKSLSILETSYKLIAKQKITFPIELAEIGLDIDDFRRRFDELENK